MTSPGSVGPSGPTVARVLLEIDAVDTGDGEPPPVQ